MQAPRYVRHIEVMLSQASQLPHLIGSVSVYCEVFAICLSDVRQINRVVS
ncbi:hypothetical protein [Pseudomonas sp. 24 E 1]|nr:hypothetical protein [Pseudomonas sp. 24 E 1]CRM06553.1 hypothetical protein [Pseudomonas sp. 35 E 8]CRM11365.1 hypothetical protein [Pseudomonas sp. 24 R 17]CRM64257.1 hypothetical protein [Pseudomonas sp. 58 R 12]CRM70669.1 hypothetical protein [Pseudomonas sp. 52 E 6]